MESTVVTEAPAPELSTIVEPRQHNDNPAANAHKEQEAPEKPEAKAKPETRMDAIKRAMSDIEAKNKPEVKEEADAKAEPAKVEAKADEKAPAEKPEARTEPEAQKTPRQPESRKIIEAPVRFLPRAKELWNNVPHEVRAEWQRAEQERDTEISQYREAKAAHDEIAEYHAMAKQSGTSLKQALQNYVGIENTFRQDPSQGFKALMQNMGLTPPQAISHILRAYGVTPEQLANHMQRDPSAYTALAPQPQSQQQRQAQPQQQDDPRVQALQQEVAQMRADRVAESVIAPFANDYPEYYQHEDAIAKVLQSGIIDQIHGSSLSPRDKLEAALFMVAPYVKRQEQRAQPPVQSYVESPPPAVDLRGTKSVKGSPSPGTDGSTRRNGKMSREDAFNAAWAELGLR